MASKHDPHHEFIFTLLERGHSDVAIVKALLQEKGLLTTRSLLGKWIKVRKARIARNTASLYPAHSGSREQAADRSTASSSKIEPSKTNVAPPKALLRKTTPSDFMKKKIVDFDALTAEEIAEQRSADSKIKF